MSEIDNRKRLLNLYESGITSAQELCEITNIPRSTVYDNLKRFREGKSEIRCPGSGRKTIFDVNDSRRAAQLAASHPQWSAQQIANEWARRGSVLVSKWTIGRTLARGNYFKSVPQKVPLMTEEHMRKMEAWCIAHQNDNFDNVIFTDESRFQFFRCTRKRWAKFGHCQKNGAEVLTSCYGMGWHKQVGINPACFSKWKYIRNKVL
jgi:transposase